MFSKRNILNCILVIILIVVAIVVYSPGKNTVQSSYEKKYGKEFCAFVYDEVMKKTKTSEVRHYDDGDKYVLKDNNGFVYKEYIRFGIKSGNYVVFEYNEYQYQSYIKMDEKV